MSGGRIAGTLPLLAGFFNEPFDPSPYAPLSRCFWNEFYIDVGKARPQSHSKFIDYRKEMAFKRRILEAEAQTFFKKRSGRDYESLLALMAAQPQLRDYSEFRAVMDRQQSGWSHWPARALRRQDSAGATMTFTLSSTTFTRSGASKRSLAKYPRMP